MDMLPDYHPVNRRAAERFMLGTDEITILAGGEQTGGDILAVEVRMPPGGGAPVMHRHAPGEIYLVLEGEFTFYLDDGAATVRRFTAAAGDVVPLAGNTVHSIRNESATDAVAFAVHSPAAVMEGFVREAATVAAQAGTEPPDMGTVLEMASRHGVELLGAIPQPA